MQLSLALLVSLPKISQKKMHKDRPVCTSRLMHKKSQTLEKWHKQIEKSEKIDLAIESIGR